MVGGRGANRRAPRAKDATKSRDAGADPAADEILRGPSVAEGEAIATGRRGGIGALLRRRLQVHHRRGRRSGASDMESDA